MSRRSRAIATSIRRTFVADVDEDHASSCTGLDKYFHLHRLDYALVRPDLFQQLHHVWNIDELDNLNEGDRGGHGHDKKDDVDVDDTDNDGDGHLHASSFAAPLNQLDDMGFSGSTFFATADTKFLIKSLPRHFEYSFFRDEFLEPYVEYCLRETSSLLVRITAFLQATRTSVGVLAGTAARFHIVMDNVKSLATSSSLLPSPPSPSASPDHGDGEDDENDEWETFDLKPTSYFYPERDVADGALTSEATKSRLADDFNDKIKLTQKQRDDFLSQLARDTKLLADCNAVDYSLFLIRVKNKFHRKNASGEGENREDGVWRRGIVTTDGEYIYRAVILDFFWAKHKAQPQAMTWLIKAYNLIDRKGPMSVTTTANEYRGRFLKMCRGIVQASDA